MEKRLLIGVFDLIHVGHLTQIESVGGPDVDLTAAVVSDAGIRQLLGAEPFLPEGERAAVLAGMRAVADSVIVGPESNWNLPAHDRLFIDTSLGQVLPQVGVNFRGATDVDIVRLPANPKLVAASRVA